MRNPWYVPVALSMCAVFVASLLFAAAFRAEHTPARKPEISAGAFAWRAQARFVAGGNITGQPALADDGGAYVAAHDGVLYALDPRGRVRWRRSLGAPIFGGIGRGPSGELYVGTDAGMLWSFDTHGTLRFKQTLDAPIEATPVWSSRDWSSSGHILVCAGRDLVALTVEGKVVFRFRAWSKLSSNPVVDEEGRAYVGSQDGNFYALSQHGKERFHVYTGAAIDADAVVDARGRAYFADETGRVLALDASGKQRWSRRIGAQVRAPLAFGPSGELLVTTQGSQWRLVALHADTGETVADRTLALADGDTAQRGSGVTVDKAGRLWLSSPVDHVWVFRGIAAPARLVPLSAELSARPLIDAFGRTVFVDRTGQVLFGHIGVNGTLLP